MKQIFFKAREPEYSHLSRTISNVSDNFPLSPFSDLETRLQESLMGLVLEERLCPNYAKRERVLNQSQSNF